MCIIDTVNINIKKKRNWLHFQNKLQLNKHFLKGLKLNMYLFVGYFGSIMYLISQHAGFQNEF